MTLKICIVSSKYNEKITDGIYKNAVVKLNVLGIKKFDSIIAILSFVSLLIESIVSLTSFWYDHEIFI